MFPLKSTVCFVSVSANCKPITGWLYIYTYMHIFLYRYIYIYICGCDIERFAYILYYKAGVGATQTLSKYTNAKSTQKCTQPVF